MDRHLLRQAPLIMAHRAHSKWQALNQSTMGQAVIGGAAGVAGTVIGIEAQTAIIEGGGGFTKALLPIAGAAGVAVGLAKSSTATFGASLGLLLGSLVSSMKPRRLPRSTP